MTFIAGLMTGLAVASFFWWRELQSFKKEMREDVAAIKAAMSKQ